DTAAAQATGTRRIGIEGRAGGDARLRTSPELRARAPAAAPPRAAGRPARRRARPGRARGRPARPPPPAAAACTAPTAPGPPPAHRLLAVFAHPDDETIGAGGLLALAVAAGVDVSVVTCTRGEQGEVIPPELGHLTADPDRLARRREQELSAALAELGVHRLL